MTDNELLDLMKLNSDRFSSEKETLYNQYLIMNTFILDEFKKNSIHRHFKTKKEMEKAMSKDFNLYNTFSWGRKKIDPRSN